MSLNSEENEIRRKFLQQNPHLVATEAGSPLLGTNHLNLFHAAIEKYQAEDELVIKKIYSQRETRRNISEWETLKEKKMTLRKHFENSNKIVKENQASVYRTCEKMFDGEINKVALKEDIENVKNEIEEYNKVQVEMEKYVGEYSMYETFLENVAGLGDGFNSVGDILNRYETLELTRKDCARLLERELEEAAELRRQMISLLEEKSTRLKNMSNTLIMMQVRCKQAKERRVYWQHIVAWLKNVITTKEEEAVVLNGGSWDIYRMICQRSGKEPVLEEHDIEGQLHYICKSILFYKEVATIATAAIQSQPNVNVPKSSLPFRKHQIVRKH